MIMTIIRPATDDDAKHIVRVYNIDWLDSRLGGLLLEPAYPWSAIHDLMGIQ